MDAKMIERINALSRKSKTAEGLTPEEKEEQARLRQAYLKEFRENFRNQMESIVIQEPDGTRHKPGQKPVH